MGDVGADAQYGSLQAYLEKALGFTAGEQESMKQKYLEYYYPDK